MTLVGVRRFFCLARAKVHLLVRQQIITFWKLFGQPVQFFTADQRLCCVLGLKVFNLASMNCLH